MTNNYSQELSFALDLCDEIDQYTLSSFDKREFSVTMKADLTPVTEIDQETERRIRAAIEMRFPDDAIEGEEFGKSGEGSNRNWVLDPIDGTKNFLRGIPVWGTLIALCVDDKPVVGVVSAPSLARRWWASVGDGAFVNGKAIHVSKVDSLSEVQASIGNMTYFDRPDAFPGSLDRLNGKVARTRGYGDFWSHMLVAEGAMECGLDAVCAPWDIAPLKIIVEEAGGTFTAFTGEDSFREGSGISTNGIMHQELCDLLIGTEKK